ncbi:hypothetical protein BUALT_Bualt13G0092900 [Buddleja alternifolia]|uniref:Anthranilate synthase n=1 Tax=Buddleja alternifolia TaxID=168488 RepID=A0AAV6WLT1_9LAMI|nr:hypothetical protein BUALT_Bualt13G0092900 [Buddleja alternifolia]
METLALSRNPLLFSHPRLSNATVTFKTLRTTVKCSISQPSNLCCSKCVSVYAPVCNLDKPRKILTAAVDHSVKFKEAANHGNLIPLYRPIFSDHLTPVLAYRCLVKEDERDAPSFLFESVEPGLKASSVGRYSVIGAQPTMEIVAKENMVTIVDHHAGQRTEEFVEDPMVVPRRIMEKWKPQRVDELPEAFCGGWVGYFSYDTVRYVEKKKLPFSKAPEDDRNLPDVHLGLYDDVIVFDHVEKKAYVIHWVRLDQFSSVEEAYDDGMDRLEALVSRVHDIVPPRLASGSIKLHTSLFGPSLSKSTMSREEYQKAVIEAKEHILAGDIFQIVLSQRFERRTFADPFEVYRALRIVNPSPYMTYLQARGCILVASSPEILTRVKKVIWPIFSFLVIRQGLSLSQSVDRDGILLLFRSLARLLHHRIHKVAKEAEGSREDYASHRDLLVILLLLALTLFFSCCFLFFKQGKITNRPLAGTVRRGKTPKEDHMLENQLLHDEKQCAEHIMLVDLGRNDVGKVTPICLDYLDQLYFRIYDALLFNFPPELIISLVVKSLARSLIERMKLERCWHARITVCIDFWRKVVIVFVVSKSGSVKVEKLKNVERYSHVMHISSTVTGELSSSFTSWDALRAALPVGTVSGAPKVKAMELIDELEVTRRGPYSGGFGGISFSGDMDIALALRTIVFPTGMRYDTMYSYKDSGKRRDWVAHLQAGAGIVADSDPADEQRECENKAAALARAIDLAESSFVDK